MSEVWKRKLHWRCRRGMLELDLLLIPFMEEAFDGLSADDRDAFISLLDEDDPDLLSWFSRKSVPVDERQRQVVDLILTRVQPG